MSATMRRCGAVATVIGLVVLLGASAGSAGLAVFNVPVFGGAQILFSASGFSAQPIFVPGFGTLSSVVIRPVIIVQQTVIIAPRRVVVLSPIVPAIVPFFVTGPDVLPAAPTFVDFSSGPPPVNEESLGNVLRAPELFSSRFISVTGTIGRLQRFVDAGGNEGTLLTMRGDWKSLNVVARGRVDTHNGTTVRATGVFFSSGDMLSTPMDNVLAALVITAP